MKICNARQPLPLQWKKFLGVGINKENLVNFIFETWKHVSPGTFKDVKEYITHGEDCHDLYASDGKVISEEITELKCSHKEADTRLLLHCSFVSSLASPDNPTQNIMIESPDTDVFILALHYSRSIASSLLFHTGKGNNLRTLDISQMSNALREEQTKMLIGLHC